MSATPRRRAVNPLLGSYFGIFVSCFLAVALVLLMLEQLGLSDAGLRLWMLAGTLVLFVAVGVVGFTTVPFEYLAAGRRVPALLTGLVTTTTMIGGTGLLALPGLIYLMGFDGLFLSAGLTAGLVVMAILIAPFLRKFGAYSIPGYLARRFESTALGIVAAAVVSIPLLMLVLAELKVATHLVAWLTRQSDATAALLVVVVLALALLPGGLRSASWSGAAQGIAMLLVVSVPAAIVSVMETNLPIPQFSHGIVVRTLNKLEAVQQIPAPVAEPMRFRLPGAEPTAIASKFSTPFSNMGALGFLFAVLAIMVGVAGHPAMLARTSATPSIYETRKSIGWALFIASAVFLTMSAVAAFMREAVLTELTDQTPAALPEWFRQLAGLGLVSLNGTPAKTVAADILMRRDDVLLALPISHGLPMAIVYLCVAGLIGAALAAATSSVMGLATVLAEDVLNGPESALVGDSQRVVVARLSALTVAAAGGWLAVLAPGDPLEIALWALAISGSTTFPVLLLSIWWKRINWWGATAGLAAGSATAVLVILGGQSGPLGLSSHLAAVAGAPVCVLAAVVVSLLTPAPGRHILEMVRELRVPGGETLYDRRVRDLLRRRRQEAG